MKLDAIARRLEAIEQRNSPYPRWVEIRSQIILVLDQRPDLKLALADELIGKGDTIEGELVRFVLDFLSPYAEVKADLLRRLESIGYAA